jgi:formylglycine-generating enzyme required for sulfatase activity
MRYCRGSYCGSGRRRLAAVRIGKMGFRVMRGQKTSADGRGTLGRLSAEATGAPAGTSPAGARLTTAPAGFVRVDGGAFTMGSPPTEVRRNSDEAQRQVTVGSFYMEKYEVTQKEWVAVMGSNPSYFKGDNLPVERVSWYDVIEYCNKRSEKEGLTPAYTINRFR